jgi:DNA-binding NarL/FixJ family response regulator
MSKERDMGQVETDTARLLLVDDQEMLGWGMRVVFSSQSWVQKCLFARTERTAAELAERHQPDIAIVGLTVGSVGCTGIARAVREVAPAVRIVLLTDRVKIATDVMLAAGACGYVATTWPAKKIVDCVRQARVAQPVVAAGLTDPVPSLSRQQHQVLRLMATGATNREIGQQLNLSPYTVQDHAKVLFRRLDVRNRAQAVQHGQRLGYLA